MSEVTVRQFAEVVGIPVDRLLMQLGDAGLSKSNADETISDLAATPTIAHKMGLRTGQSLLVRERISYTSDMQPVEHTRTYYRSDRYHYKVRLVRRAV